MSRRARRTRARSRVIRLDPAVWAARGDLPGLSEVAREAGMTLVSVTAYPCQDGTFTIRLVWRKRTPVAVSLSETIRGVRAR